MRHSESKFTTKDRARPLTPRGRREAASQTWAVARIVGGIDVAIVSGATRTRQTLIALRSTGLAVARAWEEAGLYPRGGGGPPETLHGLNRCRIGGPIRGPADAEDGVKTEAVLVIEHEPTMSTLVGLLATRENDLPESRGRAPFRALRGLGMVRTNSLKHGLSATMAVVGHVESRSPLALGRMWIIDVLHP